jgi:hypothetical protein
MLLLLLLLPALALAQSEYVTGKATPEEVVEKVHEAARFIEAHGEQGVDEFKKTRNRFVWKDTFVWVTKCEDNYCMPSPKSRQLGLISENRCLKTGKLYILELCFLSGRNPNGAWIEYWVSRPGFTEPQRKISFMQQVPDSPYQVVCDIYDAATSVEELNRKLQRP